MWTRHTGRGGDEDGNDALEETGESEPEHE